MNSQSVAETFACSFVFGGGYLGYAP